MKKAIVLFSLISALCLNTLSFAVPVDPDPALTYLGDTNGDHYFQADDMPSVQMFLNGSVAIYNMMQP